MSMITLLTTYADHKLLAHGLWIGCKKLVLLLHKVTDWVLKNGLKRVYGTWVAYFVVFGWLSGGS